MNKHSPENWSTYRLEEICSLEYGDYLPQKDMAGVGYPVFGANGVIGYHSKYHYDQPMVGVSCRGEKSGKVNMTPPKAFVTNNTIVCENLDTERVLDRFLYAYLQRVPRSRMVSGSAQPQVVIKDLKDVEVELPPLPEQRRIADVLNTVDAAIQETGRVVEKQEQVKTGLLQDLLTRGLDAEGRLRDPEREPEAFRESELGQIPTSWHVRALAACCA